MFPVFLEKKNGKKKKEKIFPKTGDLTEDKKSGTLSIPLLGRKQKKKEKKSEKGNIISGAIMGVSQWNVPMFISVFHRNVVMLM